MSINWDGTSSSDVQDYLEANPAPFDWDGFWNKVLWFGEPPAKLAHDIDQGFGNLATGMQAAGIPTSGQILGGMATADQRLEGAIGGALHAPADAANATLTAIAPYLAVAGLLWVAVEVRRAR